MKKLTIILGLMSLLLFMIPVSMALAMTTASPPTIIDNGDYIIVNPSTAMIDATNASYRFDVASMVTINSGAYLITADVKIDTAASEVTEEIASTANYMKTNGQNVDGVNITVTRNATTVNLNGMFMTIAIILPVTDNNYIEGSINTYGTTLTNGSNGADAQWFNSEVAYVLKIEISSGANIYNNCLAESVESTRTLSDNVNLGLVVATLKMPINLVANTYYANITDLMARNQEGRAYAKSLAFYIADTLGRDPATTARNAGSIVYGIVGAGLAAMNFC